MTILGTVEATWDLMEGKKHLVEVACEATCPQVIADLGGCYGVHGGYLWHALDNYSIEQGWLIDKQLTPKAEKALRERPQAWAKEINFAHQTQRSDLVLMFDILLHQGHPDWQQVVSLWAEQASAIAVYNPQWRGENSVRLTSLPLNEYFRILPCSLAPATYQHLKNQKDLEAAQEELDIWQWAITDNDLIDCFQRCGLKLVHKQDDGPWRDSRQFRWKGFLFRK